MSKKYNTVTPVLQNGEMFCWAACMEWWLMYMGSPRPLLNQGDLLAIDYIYEKVVQNDSSLNAGGLTREGIDRLFEYPAFKIQRREFAMGELTIDHIRRGLNKSPIIIAYSNPYGGGKHFNVIVKADETHWWSQTLIGMEPANPSFDYRFLHHYQQGKVILGYAA